MTLSRLAPALRAAGLCALAVMLVLAGCRSEHERPPEPPLARGDSTTADTTSLPVNPFAEPARQAMLIELGLDDYRRVGGTWTEGDASSTFTAHFAGDALQLVEEEMSMGEYGSSTNVYYFESGDSESRTPSALFYAVQDEVRARPGPASDAQRDTVRLRVALTPSGGVIASEQTVNGETESVRDATVEGVRRHAAVLRERARELARVAV